MVVGPAGSGTKPWEVLRGRIAVVREIDGDEIVVELMPMSFRGGAFRFPHNASMAVSKGELYVLDPMADDLVAERILDGCRNTDHNEFLRWVEGTAEAIHARTVSVEESRALRDFEVALEAGGGILTPTERQARVIAGCAADPIVLVQGPPGTGKTHTLAWAIIARGYAAASVGRTFHVLVTAMTHTAVEVVLRSLADKLAALDQDPPHSTSRKRVAGFACSRRSQATISTSPTDARRSGATTCSVASSTSWQWSRPSRPVSIGCFKA